MHGNQRFLPLKTKHITHRKLIIILKKKKKKLAYTLTAIHADKQFLRILLFVCFDRN